MWPYSVLGLLGIAALVNQGCGPSQDAVSKSIPATSPNTTVDLDIIRPQVVKFCGDCHLTPHPNSFPRERWQEEVERGYEFYLLSGRADLEIPPRAEVLAYFRQQAPERLAMPAQPSSKSRRFRRSEVVPTFEEGQQLGVANLAAFPSPSKQGSLEFAWCDMRGGDVTWATISAGGLDVLGKQRLGNPAHLCRTDLDGDGIADYLVSDLGSFLPEDHRQGRVVWLRPRAGGSRTDFEQFVLLDGVGRVADAEAGDFDGDGDLDVVVAVFGWHTTGCVMLLRNEGSEEGRPNLVQEILDKRTGAIHVPVVDLNGDGRADFVALLAQEHESVEAFIARPDGKFDNQVLYQAPDPSYGSSGIDLVDLDQDGDVDVLYTNGDTFDSYYAKPHHGIRWIENRGADGWKERLLANLPGVHRALAGDLDGDGDLDIAACSFISSTSRERQPEVTRWSSLVWLEQRDGSFQMHEIEADRPDHACLALCDANGDNAPDLVVGNFGVLASEKTPPVTIWLNQGRPE